MSGVTFFDIVNIPDGPWVPSVTTNELSLGFTENYFKAKCLIHSKPTFLIQKVILTQWNVYNDKSR